MTTITAKVIADSLAPTGSRLTTLELRYPRWVHAEGRTHRLLAWDEPEFLPERGPLPKSEVREPEVRPCWPGFESNFALSLMARRALFRNRSVPSRRASLALGPR